MTTLPLALVALAGLCLGSFLTVVIERLPRILARQWRSDALVIAGRLPATEAPLSLVRPASHCPRCQQSIAWHDNIPVLGWLKRRGRCAHCRASISPLYPTIELSAAVLTVAIIYTQGLSGSSIMLVGAALTLLALAAIDLRTQLLPDILTLPLLWAGLIYQLLIAPDMLESAVIGAIVGYGAMWCISMLYLLVTRHEGMGHGDFKLTAALGAWLGWEMLPLVMLIAAGTGAVCGLLSHALSPDLRGKPLPFGPWLALAGWCGLIAGDTLMSSYLSLFQP
ncbi:methyltransferase [Halomonas huangheensis]|nr:methyltransferase [Halomonas huangheensis]